MQPTAELVMRPADALLDRMSGAEDFHQCADRLRCLAALGRSTPIVVVRRDDAVAALVAFERSNEQWIAWKGPVGQPDPDVLRELLAAAATLCPVALVLQPQWADEAARQQAGYAAAESFATLLVPTVGDHLARMSDSARRRVGRGARSGLEFVEDRSMLPQFYELYAISMRAAQSPDFATHEELQALLELPRVHLFLALLDGQPVAGSVCFANRDSLEARYVATDHAHRRLGPLNFVHFHCLAWAGRAGLAALDLSGLATGTSDAKLNAINRFKLGFGGARFDYPVYLRS